jgi:hypothetical protein
MLQFVWGRFTSDSIKRTIKSKLDLVRVHGVRWEGGGTEPAGLYTFLYEKGNENLVLGTGSLCIRESYQQLREVAGVKSLS